MAHHKLSHFIRESHVLFFSFTSRKCFVKLWTSKRRPSHNILPYTEIRIKTVKKISIPLMTEYEKRKRKKQVEKMFFTASMLRGWRWDDILTLQLFQYRLTWNYCILIKILPYSIHSFLWLSYFLKLSSKRHIKFLIFCRWFNMR